MHPELYLRIYRLQERALENELQRRLAADSRPTSRLASRGPRRRHAARRP